MSLPSFPQKIKLDDPSEVQSLRPAAISSLIHSPHPEGLQKDTLQLFRGFPGVARACSFHPAACCGPGVCSVAMATNREQQVGHMTGFPPAVYPFAFNSMRSRSPFDLLANSSLFGRFGADLPKEMAALCKSVSLLYALDFSSLSHILFHFNSNYICCPYLHFSHIIQFGHELERGYLNCTSLCVIW